MEQKNIFSLITALLAGFVIGFFAGNGSLTSISPRTSPHAESPSSQFIPSETDPRMVSGTITAISGSTITLQPLFSDKTLTVTIGKDTKIVVQKDPQTYRDEIVAYHNQVPTPPNLPSPYQGKAVSAGDLHVGNTIAVTATDAIQDKSSITAVEIRIVARE